MPRFTPDDLQAVAHDALRGDRAPATTVLREVQQRARGRVRDAMRTRLEPPAPPPAAATPAVFHQAPPVAPDWPVEIRLHHGRRVRATLVPGAARRDDLATLRDVSTANDRQTFEALRQQGEALESLKRSHAELVKTVTAMQAQADRSIVALLKGIASLDQRLQAARAYERALATQTRSARRQATRQRRQLRSMAATAQIHHVNSVVGSVQTAAYGEKGSVLATSNLLIAANQLLWRFIDPIVRGMGFAIGPSPSLLTWLSPVGSLLTGELVVGGRQHVRFVAGVVEFTGDGRDQESVLLRRRLSKSFFTEFKRRSDVPVTAVPLDDGIPAPAVSGSVRDGVLTIRVRNFGGGGPFAIVLPPKGKVAWMVDTGVDGG